MACLFNGSSDMYGLGVRIGFYLLWFGHVLAGWLAPRDTPHVRTTLLLFITAAFLALIIQVSGNLLQTIEIYIVLLLVYGAYYAYIPLYLWRLASGCSPFWDPTRWPRVAPGRIFSILNFTLLVAVTCFQLWFWAAGINSTATHNSDTCPEYAFFFAAILLRNPLFIAFNIVLNVVLLICCVAHLCLALKWVRSPRWLRKKERKAAKRGIRDGRRFHLHLLQTLFRVSMAGLVIAAVELSIQWNNINGVNEVATATQLIPIIVSSGLIVHVFWIYLLRRQSGDSDSETASSYSTAEGVEVIVD